MLPASCRLTPWCLSGLLALVISGTPSECAVGEKRSGPKLDPNRCPALLFTVSDARHPTGEQHALKAASFAGGTAKVDTIMTDPPATATLLSESVLLLNSANYPKDRTQWRQSQYLLDLNHGILVQLAESVGRDNLIHYFYLGSDLKQGKAMLVRYGQGTTDTQLLDVNLKTLDTTVRRVLPKEGVEGAFVAPNFKVSPDLTRLAAMQPDRNRKSEIHRTWCRLVCLDIGTLKTRILDDEVFNELPGPSSLWSVAPPYRWIGPDEIAYQHVVPKGGDPLANWQDREHVLRCVNTRTGQISERARKTKPLAGQGDSLDELIWSTDSQPGSGEKRPHSIEKADKEQNRILVGQRVVFTGKHAVVLDCATSRSHKHTALLVISYADLKPTVQRSIIMLSGESGDPVRITGLPTDILLVGWIEDVTH